MSGTTSMEVLEVECIKEEPGWESSVSENTLLEGLYADHKVKHELVLGPELLQQVQQPPASHTVEVTVKIENEVTCEEEMVKCNKNPGNGVITPLLSKNYLKYTGINTEKHYWSQVDLIPLQNCFVRLERMILHKEQYTCKFCDKTYTQKSSLTYHIMRIHTEKKAAALKEISNKTPKRATVESKACVKKTCINKPAEEKTHMCDVCGKQFTLKVLLINHKRTHTGEKPYSCTVCNRGFTEISNLKRHKRTHTGEKPFSCEICKKQFAFKCNLMDHIRIHTKDPYSCNLCNKQFFDKSSLNRHRQTHADNTKLKKFSCDICKKQYARKYHLTRHLPTHTPRTNLNYSKQFGENCNLGSTPLQDSN